MSADATRISSSVVCDGRQRQEPLGRVAAPHDEAERVPRVGLEQEVDGTAELDAAQADRKLKRRRRGERPHAAIVPVRPDAAQTLTG